MFLTYREYAFLPNTLIPDQNIKPYLSLMLPINVFQSNLTVFYR